MDLDTILNVVQIVVSIGIIGLVLVQTKSTGGFGAALGSQNLETTKRGSEKVLHYATIFGVLLFGTVSIVRLVLA